MLVEHCGLKVNLIETSQKKAKEEEFKEKNILNQLPVLEIIDEGVYLSESNNILEYLAIYSGHT